MQLEGEVALVLQKVERDNELPHVESSDYRSLLMYIVFQQLRTTNAGKFGDAVTEYFGQLFMEKDDSLSVMNLDGIKLALENPVASALIVAPDIFPLAYDLLPHLFINTSGREFITSDDPVVLHNRYCEGIYGQGVRGWNCAGIQVFWPISPTKQIVLYDRDTYEVRSSRHRPHMSEMSRESDVAKLNSLQILDAHQNVYFAGNVGINKLLTQCRWGCSARPNYRTTFMETESAPMSDEKSGSIVSAHTPLLPINLQISMLRIKKARARIPLIARARMVRQNLPRRHDVPSPENSLPSGVYRVTKTKRI